MLKMNNTLTEALLVVFHVADGSALGSGFSATYGSTRQGLSFAATTTCRAHFQHDVSCRPFASETCTLSLNPWVVTAGAPLQTAHQEKCCLSFV